MAAEGVNQAHERNQSLCAAAAPTGDAQVRESGAAHSLAVRHGALIENLDRAYCVVEVIFDAAGEAADCRFVEANTVFRRVMSVEAPEGRGVGEASLENSREWVEMCGRVARTGKDVHFRPGGATQDRAFDAHAFRVGERGDHLVGVLIDDFSERRKSEVALRESEERYRALVESAKEYAMFLIDREGAVASWNSGAERLFGYTDDEILTRPAAILFVDEDRDAGVPAAELAVAARDGKASDDRWQRRQDGTRFWANGLTMSRRDDEGELVGFTKILRDETWRKQHEEQLQTIMQELNHRVKNTLAVVQAVAHQTLRSTANLSMFAAEFDQRLQSIAAAHRLLTRVNWKGASFTDIVVSELSVSAPSMKQVSFGGPLVMLSPKAALAMHMVIHELTTNALKFGALQTSDGRLNIRWRTTEAPEEAMELTWVEQCPHAIAQPEEAGYGSELLRTIVEYELAGEVQQEFAPTGMKCRLYFPLSSARSEAPIAPGAPVGAASDVGGVLVVEDSAALAMKLCDDLEDSGFTVVGPAARLDQAMALAQSEALCAAVLDVDLNGTKVYPLARALREQRVPFVLLTGYEVESLPEDLRDATVLSKPLTSDAVAQFLREHC